MQKQPWLDEFLKSKQFQQLKVNKRLVRTTQVSTIYYFFLFFSTSYYLRNRLYLLNCPQGTVSSVSQDSTTGSSRIINTLLTLYSNSSFQFCQAKYWLPTIMPSYCTYAAYFWPMTFNRDIPVPIAWENRDKLNSATPRRFATQPLRNWIAQLVRCNIWYSIFLVCY